MKLVKKLLLIIILFFAFHISIFAEYELERQDIYDYKEFFDELYPVEETSSSCSTVGTVYAECSGVTVGNETISLDEYVAGVIKGEFGILGNTDKTYEVMKVNAIAARSFLMAQTGCTSVQSSASFQVYKTIDPNDEFDKKCLQAAQDTAGIVMTKEGKILTGYFVTVPVSQYITKSNGNWTFDMLHQANDPDSKFTYTMPEADIYRIASQAGGILYPDEGSGHHWGIVIYGAAYEAEKGKSAEEILKIFYGDDISLAKMSTSNTSNITDADNKQQSFVCDDTEGGLSSADAKGFKKRTAQPESDNKHYFSSENLAYPGENVGQCTWYAYGRGNEILETAKSDLKMWSTYPNAGDWYDHNKSYGSKGFKSSTDVNQPKVGAIIVWDDVNNVSSCAGCGHVAVVEAVNSDNTIDISEANIGGIKSSSNPYGWQYVSNLKLSEVSNRWGYKFIGYIYIVE